MKAIRVELFQQTANYKVETSYVLKHSYPLPPYSTIIGMVHTACGFTEYHPMKISVQGDFASTHVDVNTAYYFGGIKYDKTRHQLKVKSLSKDKEIGITKGLGYTQVLNEVNLLIYILPEKEEDFDIIFNKLNCPDKFLSLGRHEDLINIISVEKVDIVLSDDDTEYGFSGFTYIPIENMKNTENGTVYKINKKFNYDKKGNRIWEEVVNVLYSNKTNELSDLYEDPKHENLIVFA